MSKDINNTRRNFLKLGSATAFAMAFNHESVLASEPSQTNLITSSPIKLSEIDFKDIVNLSAIDLSTAIKNRNVSCQEVMSAYLDRIELLNPTYNAIVSLRSRDSLILEAKQCDKELENGVYRGWMHGFPHAIKDLSAAKGIPLTLGFISMKEYIPGHDSIITERIKKAGAIIIGKTNTPEFGLGSHSYNRVFGTTVNAYDPTKIAGGSSGGAAVALALKLVPVADGSDMMGSLRNPAAYNNIIGFRPSVGRVPFGPTREVFLQQLGYEGPMGRTVAETAKLLSTIAGYDSRSPLSISEDPSVFSGDLSADFTGKKIAWLGDYDGYLPMEDGIMELCEKALAGFKEIGCSVTSASVDFSMEDLWTTWLTHRHWIIAGGLGDLYTDPMKRKEMKPEAIWEIENGLNLTASDVYKATIKRSAWYKTIDEMLDIYDYLVLPSAQVFAFDAKQHWPENIAGKKMDTYHRWMEVVIGGTLSGCPVANVPAGFNSKGLAMGLQIIGKKNRDLDVLKVAYAYEQATRWNLEYTPTITSGLDQL